MTADDDSVRISSESFSLVGRVRRRLARLLETPGIPLDPYTRRLVERRFEQEFSRVCLHVNSAAAECAALLHAEAFTVHDHIAFAAGAYAPHTDAGLRLLSHELTHVVQNRQRRGHQRPGSVYFAAEREAESISERVMSGLSATGIRGVWAPIALTASSAAIERLISRAWTDWIVTMNEQVAVLAVVRTDTDLPSTIRDLGSTMRYALFERIWGNNHRRALVQMLGGGSDSATAPMVRTNVMSMTPFLHDFDLSQELQSHLRGMGVSRFAPVAFNLAPFAALIPSAPKAPFSGVGATGVNPATLSVPLDDQGANGGR